MATAAKPKPRKKPAPALTVYHGRFGPAQAERLLWRAGFGPKRGQAQRLAKLGLTKAVHSLTRPKGVARLIGPAPTDDKHLPIAPYDAVGHDHLWWLDRMVRSNQPLVERMALIWHDWFATSNVGVKNQRYMLDQNALFRRRALGNFRDLLLDVTRDPAMLVWLNGNTNTKLAPNENYGREMMELFTLGAYRGYGEQDVREQARALTGWTSRFQRGAGYVDFHYDASLHDDGVKTIFGKAGSFDWRDSCRLCLENPAHAPYFVRKLWDYFVGTPPSARTQHALEKLYRREHEVRPVVEAILRHPALYTGPRIVKAPVVYTAGLLRAIGRGIDSAQWFRLAPLGGQRLFYPPNVAGWDETRWLDTVTFRGRWVLSAWALRPYALDAAAPAPADAAKLLDRAIAFLGRPGLTKETRAALRSFARGALAAGGRPATVENALRQLLAVSPDLQTA